MSSNHAEIAIDQLKNADDAMRYDPATANYFLGAANVHALLEIAAEIRAAGLGGWSVFDAAQQAHEQSKR